MTDSPRLLRLAASEFREVASVTGDDVKAMTAAIEVLMSSVPERALRILERTAGAHGLTSLAVVGRSHFADVVRVRDEVTWRLRRAGLSTLRIGQIMNRDHSSILTALKRFTERLRTDPALCERMAQQKDDDV